MTVRRFAALAALAALWMAAPQARAADDEAPAPESAPAAAPAAPNLRVVKVQFRGNRKVEDDAIRVNLKTAPGVTLTQEVVREDVRAEEHHARLDPR